MRYFPLLLLVLAVLEPSIVSAADATEPVSRQWTAAELYEDAVTEGLVLSGNKSALEIAEGTVVEDDGPAAGYSYQPNLETLKGDKQIRKIFVVERLPARAATLLIVHGGDLQFRLNGKPLTITGQKQFGPFWKGYEFDPALLREGKNELIVTGKGRLRIAREDEYAAGSLRRKHHPDRSAKSLDGGKTWNSDRLGDQNNVDGEYCIRLALDQVQPLGMLTTPVIDLGNLTGDSVGRPLVSPGVVRLSLDCVAKPPHACRLQVRSGFLGKSWSAKHIAFARSN